MISRNKKGDIQWTTLAVWIIAIVVLIIIIFSFLSNKSSIVSGIVKTQITADAQTCSVSGQLCNGFYSVMSNDAQYATQIDGRVYIFNLNTKTGAIYTVLNETGVKPLIDPLTKTQYTAGDIEKAYTNSKTNPTKFPSVFYVVKTGAVSSNEAEQNDDIKHTQDLNAQQIKTQESIIPECNVEPKPERIIEVYDNPCMMPGILGGCSKIYSYFKFDQVQGYWVIANTKDGEYKYGGQNGFKPWVNGEEKTYVNSDKLYDIINAANKESTNVLRYQALFEPLKQFVNKHPNDFMLTTYNGNKYGNGWGNGDLLTLDIQTKTSEFGCAPRLLNAGTIYMNAQDKLKFISLINDQVKSNIVPPKEINFNFVNPDGSVGPVKFELTTVNTVATSIAYTLKEGTNVYVFTIDKTTGSVNRVSKDNTDFNINNDIKLQLQKAYLLAISGTRERLPKFVDSKDFIYVYDIKNYILFTKTIYSWYRLTSAIDPKTTNVNLVKLELFSDFGSGCSVNSIYTLDSKCYSIFTPLKISGDKNRYTVNSGHKEYPEYVIDLIIVQIRYILATMQYNNAWYPSEVTLDNKKYVMTPKEFGVYYYTSNDGKKEKVDIFS